MFYSNPLSAKSLPEKFFQFFSDDWLNVNTKCSIHFVANFLLFQKTTAIFNDFACTRRHIR